MVVHSKGISPWFMPISIWPLDSVDRMHCLWSLQRIRSHTVGWRFWKPHSSHLIAQQWMEYMRFFFRNCQGIGGTEFQHDYDVTVFFVWFFSWIADFYRFCSGQIPYAFDLPKPAHVFFWTALCTWKPITPVRLNVHVVTSHYNM